MPGVEVRTSTSGSVVNEDIDYPYQWIIAGLAERGPATTPVIIEGMGDYELVFGGYVSYSPLWNQLNTFFDEGGTRAIVSRVVGPAATKGSLTLVDGDGEDTLKVEAYGPGSWSTQISVVVDAGSVTGTFRIKVLLGTTILEDMDLISSPADAAYRFSGSAYVRLIDMGSDSTDPKPVALTATPLSAGNDDRGNVTYTQYLAALDAVDKSYGDGAVSIPGQTSSNIYLGIQNHCVANSRIGILSAARGTNDATLIATAQALNSEYMGLFHPWVVVADGLTVKTISPEGYVAACRARTVTDYGPSPEGYVAACRARTVTDYGPWRAAAGAVAEARSILDVDQEYDSATGNTLDSAKVNLIRTIANTVRVYGWRSLSQDEANYAFLTHRDMLNRLVVQAEGQLEQYVFSPVDSKGQLLSRIAAELTGIVQPYKDAGGLYSLVINGKEIDAGYKIDVSPTVNTPASLAHNEIRAVLKVRVAPVGSLITLDIVKVGSRTPM